MNLKRLKWLEEVLLVTKVVLVTLITASFNDVDYQQIDVHHGRI